MSWTHEHTRCEACGHEAESAHPVVRDPWAQCGRCGEYEVLLRVGEPPGFWRTFYSHARKGLRAGLRVRPRWNMAGLVAMVAVVWLDIGTSAGAAAFCTAAWGYMYGWGARSAEQVRVARSGDGEEGR